jgi:transcriptional regulator with XRE-family HTH domain
MISVYTQRYQKLLERLQSARREAGLTQIAVAHAFGKPQSFVSKCESGERRIDVVELGAFAHLYQKPLAYFVAETDAPTGASLSVDGEAEASSPPQPAARASRKSGARGSTAAKRSKR